MKMSQCLDNICPSLRVYLISSLSSHTGELADHLLPGRIGGSVSLSTESQQSGSESPCPGQYTLPRQLQGKARASSLPFIRNKLRKVSQESRGWGLLAQKSLRTPYKIKPTLLSSAFKATHCLPPPSFIYPLARSDPGCARCSILCPFPECSSSLFIPQSHLHILSRPKPLETDLFSRSLLRIIAVFCLVWEVLLLQLPSALAAFVPTL